MTLISALRSRAFVSVLSLACAALTGCGARSISTGADPLNKGGITSGTLYGGNQPVVGSVVQLWSVGTSGYGSQGTLLATATTTGPSGGFSFAQSSGLSGPDSPVDSSYGCPTGTTQLYLLATGGNTGSGINANHAAIAAIGPCNTAGSQFINMNEVTTVATMAAMQQFFDPNTDSLGSPAGAQAQLGLANAQTTIANLADISVGAARLTYTVPNATGISGPVMTASTSSNGGVNGYLKLNTIANILAACVNSNGVGSTPDNCTTLFTNAIPPAVAYTSHVNQSGYTFPTASDTVQAAYYILSNPTQSQDIGTTGKLHNLFSLASSLPPFAGLSAQPLDWTIHVLYTATGNCSSNANKAFYNSTTHFAAVDALGDVWVGGGSSSANSVTELGPNGAPTGCYGGGVLPTSSSIALDPNGSVYVGSAANSQIYVIPNTGTAASPSYGTAFTWTTPAVFGGFALDPSGNLFFTPTTKTAAPLQEYQLSSVTSAPVSTTSPRTVGSSVSSQTSGTYSYVASDSNGRIFAPNNVYAAAGTFAELFPSTATGNVGGYQLTNVAPTKIPATNPYGVAVDSSNKVFSSTTCCAATTANIIYSLAISSDNSTVNVVSSPKFLGGITQPRGLSIDGAGNVWSVMSDEVVLATSTQPAIYAISEVSNDLTTGLSPNSATGAQANPSTCSSGSTCATGGGFQDANFPSNATALAIDPSGNVWLPNGSGSSGISEIVGQAVPVTTPTATAPGKLPN